MVDSAKPLGQEPGGGLPPAEAAPVEVPVDGAPQEAAPAAVPVEPAPAEIAPDDLGPAQQAVGEAAAAEEVVPATKPAPIEASAKSPEDLSRMVAGDEHENLENSLVGDQGPNPEEVLPGQEEAITGGIEPDIYSPDPLVPEQKPAAAAVPAEPVTAQPPAAEPVAPQSPATKDVTPLNPSYRVESEETEGDRLRREISELTEQMAEIERKRDVIKPQADEYDRLTEELKTVYAKFDGKWKEFEASPESKKNSQVG